MPRLADLVPHLRSLSEPIVVGHENADPDAVASAYVIANLLGSPLGFPGDVSREGKALLRFLDATYHINPGVEGKDLVVVDTSYREMLGGLDVDKARSVTVIDHHSTRPTLSGTLFVFPSYSSTSEIVYRALISAGVRPSEKEKIALLHGIFFDTKGLRLATGETLGIVSELLGDKSVEEALKVVEIEEDVSERIARLKALRKGEIVRVGEFLVAVAETGSFEGSVASILLQAGADLAVAYSTSSEGDRVSIRLSDRSRKLGITMELAFKALEETGGRCGGHEMAGGCKLPPGSARRAVELLLDKVLSRLESLARKFGVRRY